MNVRHYVADRSDEFKARFFTALTLARARKRKKLFDECDECFYCTRKLTLPVPGQQRQRKDIATLDHVIPMVHGGGEHLSNFVLSCKSCNNMRGDMEFHLYHMLCQLGELSRFRSITKNNRRILKNG